MESSASKLFILFLSTALLLGTELIQCTVTYDNKAIIINGRRRILIAGAIHYPRSTPDMWEGLMQKAKDGGLDVIDTYVFWNGHEPSPGVFNFKGNYDLVHFVKTAQKVGLYVMLRIGPYVCSEWKYGGIPVWLKFVPGCTFRTYNEPFMDAMQKFTKKIVLMMKHHNLFESLGKGGPIILSQIENEYGGMETLLGAPGRAYMNWTANMAVGLDTGVPWVMCKEPHAPDPVINTFNGFYCDNFTPNKPNKPIMWTETWTGWFTVFGGPIHKRPVEDLAFAVARFIQRGGSFLNYYMYHGGTNFGRTAGGPFITSSYDYDAPIDEYGLIRDPKYTHLKELHSAIKKCEQALVSSDPTVLKLGPAQLAYVFYGQGTCSAFLSNKDTSAAQVTFNYKHFKLPPWSTSILPNCSNPDYEVFNTAKVRAQTSKIRMVPTNSMIHSWATYGENIASLEESATITAIGLLEQINITRDTSDYLWYITSIYIDPSESFLRGGPKPTLYMVSYGDGAHVFINGELSGSAYGSRNNMKFKFNGLVNLRAGMNTIALLSLTMGSPNIGLHYETWQQGILGPVSLQGLDQGNITLTGQKWTYKVGMKGEALHLGSPKGVSSVKWTKVSPASKSQKPLTWYKAYFDEPAGNKPLALDLLSMGKGQAWINGQSIGRYWPVTADGNCGTCSHAARFNKTTCLSGCGQPTQRWYHVPRSWLQPKDNLLVIFEELIGDVCKIKLVKRTSSYS